MRRAVLLSVLLLLACTLVASAAPARAKVVTVKPKATLWGIAKQHRVTVRALRAFNDLEEDEVLRAGRRLRIPPRSNTSAKVGARKAAQRASKAAKSTGKAAKRASKAASTAWVYAKPPRWTQTQKTKAQRGGINPCNTPNPGPGSYTKWSREPLLGQMVMPRNKALLADGNFNVMFHFHGHEPIRKEWVQVMDRTVLVAVTLGVSSRPYVSAFGSSKRFEALVSSVEKAVAKHIGKKKAHARNIGLSSWSAGYGALARILNQRYGKRRVDTVVVLDGMHTSYRNGRASASQLAPFTAFARAAAKGRKHMFVSHSSIVPPGYASSTETANLLIHQIGARPARAHKRASDPMGLELISRFSRGNLHVRGFAGNDKMDHCAHIGLFRDVLKVHVRPRWERAKKR